MKIFIVDQSKLIKQNLEKLLAGSFEINTASYADTALLKIIDWEPDIIISGVEIGNITGFDLCILLKMIPRYASKPFILLSSQSPAGVSEKAKEVGADLYLEKKMATLATIKDKINGLLPSDGNTNLGITSILLVDDSTIIRLMISNMLKGLGVETIIQASNGEEALELIESRPFDLMITDYHMPIMDGPTLIKEIRSHISPQQLPIILATGLEKEKIGLEFKDAGLQSILAKPVSVHDLRQAMSQLPKTATES